MPDEEVGLTRTEQASQLDAHTLAALGPRVHRLHVSHAPGPFAHRMSAAILRTVLQLRTVICA
jgi:hypothetical protein